jgi:hypothetical protein
MMQHTKTGIRNDGGLGSWALCQRVAGRSTSGSYVGVGATPTGYYVLVYLVVWLWKLRQQWVSWIAWICDEENGDWERVDPTPQLWFPNRMTRRWTVRSTLLPMPIQNCLCQIWSHCVRSDLIGADCKCFGSIRIIMSLEKKKVVF